MNVIVYSNAADFLEKVLPYLELEETANNLIIGLAFRLVNQPDFYPLPPFLAAVEQDGAPVLAALMTPPHHITLAGFCSEPDRAYIALCQALLSGGWSLPGVRAPASIAAGFAEHWAKISGAQIRSGQSLRAYELRQVILPRPVNGEMRLADMSDLELAAQWTYEFALEALEEDDRAAARRNVEIKIRAQELYFWQDGQPVSMAASTRPTRHGISIGSVYTPPSRRGRGYASALVAALSQRMLDRGCQFVSLFTNLANPTSNHIYQDIGYRPVCDFAEIHFDQPN
jgi:hypothetical protein